MKQSMNIGGAILSNLMMVFTPEKQLKISWR
jgi:hypothetical protein